MQGRKLWIMLKVEFIAYLDADDFYHREKIQRQMDVMISDFANRFGGLWITFTFWNGRWETYQCTEVKRYLAVKIYRMSDNLPITMPTALMPEEIEYTYIL